MRAWAGSAIPRRAWRGPRRCINGPAQASHCRSLSRPGSWGATNAPSGADRPLSARLPPTPGLFSTSQAPLPPPHAPLAADHGPPRNSVRPGGEGGSKGDARRGVQNRRTTSARITACGCTWTRRGAALRCSTTTRPDPHMQRGR